MDQKRLIANPNFLLPLIVLVFGLCNFFWGEVIAVADGFGWDGRFYRDIAKDFPEYFFGDGLSEYRLQKVVPSGIVYYGLRLLSLQITDINVLTGFRVLGLILIMLSTYMYLLIAGELDFTVKSKWLGFIGLFISVASSKHFFYNPALPDQLSFTIGFLSLYFFLKNKKLVLLLLILVGSFTSPLFLYCGLLLFIFPNKQIEKFATSRYSSYFVVIPTIIIYILAIYWFYFVKQVDMRHQAVRIVDSVVYLSIVCSIAYLYFGLKVLLDQVGIPDVRTFCQRTIVVRLAVGIITFFSVKSLIANMAGKGEGLTGLFYAEIILLESIVRPFGFYISHVVYFGPIILIILFSWKSFSKIISQYGLGLTLLIMGNFLISIGTESRHLVGSLPFFVVFTVMALEKLKWDSTYYWFFGVVSLFYSKIWLRMNCEPMTGGLLQFPLQYYLMNLGPWMSHEMYITHGILVIITAILIFYFVRNQMNATIFS